MILIGSAALKEYYPEVRTPRDYDLIVTEEELYAFSRRVESLIHSYEDFGLAGVRMVLRDNGEQFTFDLEVIGRRESTQELLNHFNPIVQRPATYVPFLAHSVAVAPPQMLWLLKRSHIYWPKKFAQNIQDLELLKGYAAEVPKDLLRLRYKETVKVKEPLYKISLDKQAGEFFGAAKRVDPLYLHDDLHVVVANGSKPVYETMLTDGAEVLCDRDKWRALPHWQKILAVQEEAMVIALERILIPDRIENSIEQIPPGLSDHRAFLWALMRICTTLTSGWFRAFAVENYNEVLKTHNTNYWSLFLNKQSTLKPRR